MDASLVSLSAVSLALIPVVLGLVSIAKGFIDAKYAPAASIVIGVGLAFVVPATTVALTVLQGILMGLSASGLYSGVKTTMSIGEK